MGQNKVPINRANKFLLYGLFCPITNELRYIGTTTRNLDIRLKEHLRNPTNGKIKYWFNQLNKINLKPVIKLLEEYENYNELLNQEIIKIKESRDFGTNLLNISDGGDLNPMQGKTHTKEAREKISAVQKGRKRTKKEKLHLSIIMKNKWNGGELIEWSEEMKNNLRKRMYGNSYALNLKHSNETKKIISKKLLNNKNSLGFKHSEETKKRMSINNSGENNPMYGKSLSKDILKKRSEKVKKEGTYKGNKNGNYKYDIDIIKLENLFVNENMTKKELSEFFGCSEANIIRILKNNNIKKPLSNIYNFNYNDLYQYFVINNLTQKEIALKYNTTNKYIHKVLKKYNLLK